jgi:transcriptional regulator GlxA family with amidase domain
MLRRCLFALIVAALAACSSSPSSSSSSPGDPSTAVPAGSEASKQESAAAGEGAIDSKASPLKLIRTLGVVLYPKFELLDVYGPVEMFTYVGPQLKVVMIAEKAGAIESFNGPKVIADYGFNDAPKLDLIMVPGGFGTVPELVNADMANFLRARAKDAEIVMSVCSGSAILAKVGLLDGYKATSNKRFFTLAKVAGPNVNWIEKARWVEDRDRVTSSGVSAGTDMSLAVISRLYGESTAKLIADMTEYTWHRDANEDPFFRP